MIQKIKEFILRIPFIYNFVQWVFGSKKGFRKMLEYIDVKPKDTILDIDCGTARALEYFPKNVKYIGYDLSEEYLQKAREKYKDWDAEFHCQVVSKVNLPLKIKGKCDKVLVLGVLHHLSDEEVQDLFDLADFALKKGCKLVSVDPAFVDKQNFIAKKLVGADRGQYVRHMDQYRELYKKYFKGKFEIHKDNLNKFPYNHSIVIAEKKGK